MCYFHVIYNIKKIWKARLGMEKWTELKSYIKNLNLSRNKEEKDRNWELFVNRDYEKRGKKSTTPIDEKRSF